MCECCIGCMWLRDGNRREFLNFMDPFGDLTLNIPFNEGVCANSCSKVSFPFYSDGNASSLESCSCFLKVALFHYQAGLGGIWVVSEVWSCCIPPGPEVREVSASCGIICVPDLHNLFILKVMDQWNDGYCIHCHGKGISLGSAFLRKQNLAIYEQLNIISVGVNKDWRWLGTGEECSVRKFVDLRS